ncbi:MAG: AAA family ATPase [Planctomycetales bacterium]|nr:AAA family ATPase [Planctomycetales bacterium]
MSGVSPSSGSADQVAQVSEFLRNPSSYPDRPRHVEVRETHISRVFLTDKYAYKLKKPVTLDFLDFSTMELRKLACEEELRLNRRLAPSTYLEVVPVTIDAQGQFELSGPGKAVDWVVKMHRLNDAHSLDTLIRTNAVSAESVDSIARRLARFYRELPPVSVTPDEYRLRFDAHLRANRQTLLDAPGDSFSSLVVKHVHTAQLRYLHVFHQEFERRVHEGRIVEGHGDLRPEHIYLNPDPLLIDCIEFAAEFRQLDVIDELSFLAVECKHRGAAWIGDRIVEHYLEASGDRPPSTLQAFYACYRACVRAKVHLLRGSQLPKPDRSPSIAEAKQYLEMAEGTARELGPPSVLIVRGAAGVGKTTLAQKLTDLLCTEYLQTDALRRELFGKSGEPVGHNKGQYTAENRNRVYELMFERAEQLISDGLSVVLDGTFLTNCVQAAAVEMANRQGARPFLVNCTCPPEVAATRISGRLRVGGSLSEAQTTTHMQHRAEEELPRPEWPQCVVDTSTAEPLMIQTTLDGMRAQMSG